MKNYKSGIYVITNLVTNMYYIGSAVNLRRRELEHFSRLKKGNHRNNYLQNACNKYGIENFDFKILEYCEKEDLISLEQYYIDLSNFEKLYNLNPVASSRLGTKQSNEAKAKISASWKGKTHSEESKLKMKELSTGELNSFFGKTHSKETRQKMSESSKGKKHPNFGKQTNEATRQKIRESLKNYFKKQKDNH